MLGAGAQALRQHRITAMMLYLVQFGVGLLFTMVVGWVLNMLYGHRPLFDRGVAGDDAALVFALAPHMATMKALVIFGVALAFAYSLLSQFLTAGLIGTFRGRPFGESATRWFPAYVRVWILSLVPYAVGGVIAMLGSFMLSNGRDDAFSMRVMFGRPLLGALPGLFVITLTSLAVDYARVGLVATDERGALRALARGFRHAVRLRTLVHYKLYLLFWLSVSAVYVAATIGHPWGGTLGLWLLFALRQVVNMLRFGARVVTYGGQLALVSEKA
jgi:hypothetical protein